MKAPSKKETNKAAQSLTDEISGKIMLPCDDHDRYFKIIQQWRARHAAPMNSLRQAIRGIVRKTGDEKVIIARRLKTMGSILGKISRFENTQLTRMQDIGGIRVIFSNMKYLNKFREECEIAYKTHDKAKQNRTFEIIPVGEEDKYDYITRPKNDGYRSYHQVYQLISKDKHLESTGLKVELQMRTKIQHDWATAVETYGTLMGESLKAGKGDIKARRFFELSSALFALHEKMPLGEAFNEMPPVDIIKQIKQMDDEIKIIEKLSVTAVVASSLENYNPKKETYLVIWIEEKEAPETGLNLNGMAFGNDSLKTAKEVAEAMERDPKKRGVVMIMLDNIKSLKKAYPNYYLDTTDFIKLLKKLIRESN